MKILVLTSTYPRWDNDTEPRFVADLCAQLSLEHEIHVLAPHTAKAKTFEQKENLKIFRFRYCFTRLEKLAYNGGILPNLKKNPATSLLIPLFLLSQIYAIYSLVKKNDYQVIHAHWIIPQGITASIVRVLLGKRVKLLITSHGGDLFSLNGVITKRVKQWTLKHCDHLTVVSQTMKDKAMELGVAREKVSIAPMGVDLTNTFIPPVDNSERNGIIFVGRLVEKKGVEYLIKAFKIVLEHQPHEILTIIGDGPLLKTLQKLSQDCDINDSVIFKGAIENHLIPSELQKAQIAVIPSIVTSSGDQEGLGLTIIEALGCECAVIASDLPAIKDIIPSDEFGLLAKPRDAIDLSNQILNLLGKPELTIKLAKNGRKRSLSLFDWRSSGENYMRLVRKITPKGVE